MKILEFMGIPGRVPGKPALEGAGLPAGIVNAQNLRLRPGSLRCSAHH
jgi:hypothetical protein